MAAFAPLATSSALIFGGCCSNVYCLEAIVQHEPASGLLITLFQFIYTCASALYSQFDARGRFFLKPVPVPLHKWSIIAALFFSVNMLNNWAFAFHISVPVHIILRSFGSVSTMAAGWLRGKKYSPLQVASVAALTAGVIVSAWADARNRGKNMDASAISVSDASFKTGLAILLVAQLLSAGMGAYVEDLYQEHGNYWQANLFYSHLLSIPLFLPFAPVLRDQFFRLHHSTPLDISGTFVERLPDFLAGTLATVPQLLVFLIANALTQLLCITGVNMLSAATTAVTVTVILNLRKLVSFLLSIWLFGNPMGGTMKVGAAMVFGAGALYGVETSYWIPKRRKALAEEKKTP